MAYPSSTLSLALFAFFVFYASPVAAFGAGNIGKLYKSRHLWLILLISSPASISKIEGHNWRQYVVSEFTAPRSDALFLLNRVLRLRVVLLMGNADYKFVLQW